MTLPNILVVDEARRLHADLIYVDAVHAPLKERAMGPTVSYLLDKRPCRVVVEIDPQQAAPVAQAPPARKAA